ncbi:MAG: UDP-N-acetylmuramate dehydrogenase [Deltaproteobacteria bacterium]|nr:UDP-N-acetylmuramate dehydrogenase [Deltaproteobacteria bacterium]
MPLAPLTTLRLGGEAAYFLAAHTIADVQGAVAWAQNKGVPLLVLGGGSNVVMPDAGWDGLVLHMQLRGQNVSNEGALIHVVAAAGEPWDAFVQSATRNKWAGVECLAGIPGLVGSTPIQNVGAYGQDVSETIARVRVLERATGALHWLTKDELQFSYRDSVLRRELSRFIVVEVAFDLRAGGAPSVRYAELQHALAATANPTLLDVRAQVLALRRKKSMVLDAADPNSQSVGSFFTNPLVDVQMAAEVARIASASGLAHVPQWPQPDGRVKLAAGWLIENAGFSRGLRRGAVGLSSAHALALVHFGGGTSNELLALARQVRDGVKAKFGVTLQPEPILIGASL